MADDTRNDAKERACARNNEIRSMRAEGMTYSAIGAHFGISKQAVSMIVNPPESGTQADKAKEYYQRNKERINARVKARYQQKKGEKK